MTAKSISIGRKVLITIPLLLSFLLSSYGQQVSFISYQDHYPVNDSIWCSFYQGDSLISSPCYFKEDSINFNNLKPGSYSFHMYVNDTLRLSYPGIILKEGLHKTIYVHDYVDFDDSITTEYYPDDAFGIFRFKFSPASFSVAPEIAALYEFEAGYGGAFYPGKNRRLGFGGGYLFSLRYVDFTKNGLSDHDDPFMERYFNVNLGWYLHTRLVPFRRKDKSPGLILDIGAKYNFPLYFRHAYRVDNRKYHRQWIHQYKDLSAYADIIINQKFGLSAEYRLSDYLKAGYPELPRWVFGINLMIQ